MPKSLFKQFQPVALTRALQFRLKPEDIGVIADLYEQEPQGAEVECLTRECGTVALSNFDIDLIREVTDEEAKEHWPGSLFDGMQAFISEARADSRQ